MPMLMMRPFQQSCCSGSHLFLIDLCTNAIWSKGTALTGMEGKKLPIVLVGNKSDLQLERAVTRDSEVFFRLSF